MRTLERWVCRFGGSIMVLCFGSTAHAQAVPVEQQTAPTTAPSAAPAPGAVPAASPPLSAVPGAAPAAPPVAPAAAPAATPPAAPTATPPAAPTAAAITVVTTDGAVFRGELIEKWPERHVTVRLSTGEYRRILWQHIARLVSGAEPINATTQVSFRSEHKDAALQRLGSGGAWFEVCRTPCAGKVATRGVYRVAGDGLRGSEPFTLSRYGQYVAIETTRVGSNSTCTAGGIMAVGGGAAAYIGLLVLASSISESYGDDWDEDTDSDRDSDELGSSGVILLLGGTAIGIVGLVTLLRNKTKVELVDRKRRGAAPAWSTGERAGFSLPLSRGLALTERGLVW